MRVMEGKTRNRDSHDKTERNRNKCFTSIALWGRVTKSPSDKIPLWLKPSCGKCFALWGRWQNPTLTKSLSDRLHTVQTCAQGETSYWWSIYDPIPPSKFLKNWIFYLITATKWSKFLFFYPALVIRPYTCMLLYIL